MEKLSKIVLIFLIIGSFGFIMNGYLKSKEFYKHHKQTICKYTFCKQYPKTTKAYVKYCVNNKLYRQSAGRCPVEYDLTINKYFLLDYSTIDPNEIRVDFSKEIKDSLVIKELESKLEFKYLLDH